MRPARYGSSTESAYIRDNTVTNVRDEPQEIVAIDGGIAEALSLAVAMRVQATTADLHHLAVQIGRAHV